MCATGIDGIDESDESDDETARDMDKTFRAAIAETLKNMLPVVTTAGSACCAVDEQRDNEVISPRSSTLEPRCVMQKLRWVISRVITSCEVF